MCLFALFFRRLCSELGYRDKTGDRVSGANGTARAGASIWLSSDSAENPNVVRLTRIRDMLSHTHAEVNEMGCGPGVGLSCDRRFSRAVPDPIPPRANPPFPRAVKLLILWRGGRSLRDCLRPRQLGMRSHRGGTRNVGIRTEAVFNDTAATSFRSIRLTPDTKPRHRARSPLFPR